MSETRTPSYLQGFNAFPKDNTSPVYLDFIDSYAHFIIHEDQLHDLLPKMKSHYSILNFNGISDIQRKINYFDNTELSYFHNMMRAKRNSHLVLSYKSSIGEDTFLQVRNPNSSINEEGENYVIVFFEPERYECSKGCKEIYPQSKYS